MICWLFLLFRHLPPPHTLPCHHILAKKTPTKQTKQNKAKKTQSNSPWRTGLGNCRVHCDHQCEETYRQRGQCLESIYIIYNTSKLNPLTFTLVMSQLSAYLSFCLSTLCLHLCLSVWPPRWPSGKVSTLRAEDPGFGSRFRRDFFWVESYQWLKNWHSSGYPARHLTLKGQHWDWSARCQYTVTGWGRTFDLQLLSQCGSM